MCLRKCILCVPSIKTGNSWFGSLKYTTKTLTSLTFLLPFYATLCMHVTKHQYINLKCITKSIVVVVTTSHMDCKSKDTPNYVALETAEFCKRNLAGDWGGLSLCVLAEGSIDTQDGSGIRSLIPCY